MRISCEGSRHIVIGGGLGIRFPPPLPLMPIARSLTSFSGYLSIVRLIFMFAFQTNGRRVRLELRFGGLRNGRFLLSNAERVWALWPLFFLGRFKSLGGGGESS